MKYFARQSVITSKKLLTALVIAFSVSCLTTTSVAAADKWVGTWATAQQSPALGFGDVPPVFNDQTLRQIVQVSIGGSELRVRFSNVMGSQPLTIDAASVAKRDTEATIADETLRTLSFGGSASVTIPDGAFVLSDPVLLDVQAFDELAISLYLANETTVNTLHRRALQTNYVSSAGNHTGTAEFPIESMNESWYLLSGVDIMASSDTTVIAALGDSITDGFASTPDTNNRYPSLLALRLAEAGNNAGVLNLGISGNRVLHGVIGPNALARFDRDVISRPGVTHVILLEGINDIGLAGLLELPEQEVTADQIIRGYQQLIQRARDAGVKIIGATLTPFKTAFYYTNVGESKRLEVNDWIRNSGEFDGIVDFDEALRDPNDQLQMLPSYDVGDNLHPSDAGYQAMANAFNLSLFGQSGEGAGNLSASRYDAGQGEVFWNKGNNGLFNVYRDEVLQSSSPIDGSSFFQDNLEGGLSYLYNVVAVDPSGNETGSIGSVVMPSNTE